MNDLATTAFWRVHCHVGQNPGQWPFWFREQCCAVGWPPPEYSFDGPSPLRAWSTVRNVLREMKSGDSIVATLPGNRIGRLGTVVSVRGGDHQWDPIVPRDSKRPYGENGRRVLVRWDLTVGPAAAHQVVLLPPGSRIPAYLLHGTARRLPVGMLPVVRSAMLDEANWTSLVGRFSMEAALSDYIALHPERLETGMITHPSLSARELTFDDRTRADVILEDRERRTVVVECKQGTPSMQCVDQASRYRSRLAQAYPHLGDARVILVHGGSSRVNTEVANYSQKHSVELVYHELQVSFINSRS